jgi:hypothetical protein
MSFKNKIMQFIEGGHSLKNFKPAFRLDLANEAYELITVQTLHLAGNHLS